MKWVNASERLPSEVGKRYFVKFKNGTHLSNGTAGTLWKDGKKKEILFVNFNPDSSHYIVDNVFQWLDETANDDREKEIEWLKGLIEIEFKGRLMCLWKCTEQNTRLIADINQKWLQFKTDNNL